VFRRYYVTNKLIRSPLLPQYAAHVRLRASGANVSMKICASLLSLLPVVVSVALVRSGQDSTARHNHVASEASAATSVAMVAGLKIPDTVLVNQHGERVRFYSDLVKGRVVAINTIYTTCTTICPLMGANFASLSRLLAKRGDGNINLISISIDPVTDTPARLDQWSRGFGEPGPGWTLLTGSKADVDGLLKALRIFTLDKDDHTPVALIGNAVGVDWTRASALMPPARLAELIDARVPIRRLP
jgi:cytochrome oxidase Cu insertion factor (SCO1/SenC/PrrC family)